MIPDGEDSLAFAASAFVSSREGSSQEGLETPQEGSWSAQMIFIIGNYELAIIINQS